MSPSILLAVGLMALGCGGSLPAPPLTAHPLSAYIEVPYPPPAALAETVPEQPHEGLAWVDGEWNYHGKSYVWKRGGWVGAPSMWRFAPWRVWYRRDGRLMMAAGTWYDERRRSRPSPDPVVAAVTPSNEITSEFQTGR